MTNPRHLALRDALAQRLSDLAQDAMKQPRVPLDRRLLACEFRDAADALLTGAVSDEIARIAVGEYDRGRDDVLGEWRAQGGVGMERDERERAR